MHAYSHVIQEIFIQLFYGYIHLSAFIETYLYRRRRKREGRNLENSFFFISPSTIPLTTERILTLALKYSRILWGFPRTDSSTFQVLSLLFVCRKKLKPKNKLNQKSDNIQKQRKIEKQNQITIVYSLNKIWPFRFIYQWP